jgi:hypothetical protein
MIEAKDCDENGKFIMPERCPICKKPMSVENNITTETCEGGYRSILFCGRKGCEYKKILDFTSNEEVDEESTDMGY